MPSALQPTQPASLPPVPPAGTPGLSTLTGVVVAVVVVAALYFGREVLMPVTLAMLLSFVLTPLVELLRRLWLGRIVSVLLAVILALGIIVALGTAIGTQVGHISRQLPQYQSTVENKLRHFRSATVNQLTAKVERIGNQLKAAGGQSAGSRAPGATGSTARQRKPLPVIVMQPAPTALQIGEAVLLPILSPALTAGIILVVTIFTLLQREDLRDRAIRLFGSKDLRRTTVAINDAGRRLSRYFLTQLGINTGFGVIVGTGLYFIGVPNPMLLGIVSALLRFVPYVGSWIAALLALVLAAAVGPGWTMMIWTAVLYGITELAMGQFVEPLIYGHSTGLSPLAVVIAAIFWTWIWGPIGLIISTPLTLCVVVLGRHAERLDFLAVLLGDRPALTPEESFYQRILADDPDEVEAQAERYLADETLSSYYDEVALKGLQLAANDVARGELSATKAEHVKASIKELIEDLDKYDDVPPADEAKEAVAAESGARKAPSIQHLDAGELTPSWQADAPVLCIAGRGSLDEAAACMLAQLLRKHRLGARVVPYEAVSRTHIGALDVQEVAMACISYIDIGGNPAHLRYLLLRLRKRLPETPLLVGLWPSQDPSLEDSALRAQAGADYYVSSLRQAVDACLAEAHGTPRARLATVAQASGSGV
ncbi:MAG TPA: AI-2E family transporter [Steroidobacteraceae bacterium]|nr:AI-2E family transporter [Steroidobacteraceae bacterium]